MKNDLVEDKITHFNFKLEHSLLFLLATSNLSFIAEDKYVEDKYVEDKYVDNR